MTTLQIFDRPMCCSTGVCGPKIDPVLPRFAGDIEWLKAQGVAVERYNLAQQPGPFTQYDDVKAALMTENVACLPLFRVDGEIVFKGNYPSRSMLASWCGVNTNAAETACCGSSGCC